MASIKSFTEISTIRTIVDANRLINPQARVSGVARKVLVVGTKHCVWTKDEWPTSSEEHPQLEECPTEELN